MTSAPVVLPALSGRQAQAWDALMSVAGSLGDGWTLIGGLAQIALASGELRWHRCNVFDITVIHTASLPRSMT